ncbi:MAG: cyanophycin synthetase, partial [Terriglobales bacterium]
ITDIALDHQKYLGETVAEIAREKAGIIRPGGVVVTLPQLPEANDVIGNAILDAGALAVNAVPYVPPLSPGSDQSAFSGQWQRYPLDVIGTEIMVESPLVGRHQLRNLALAIAAAVELHDERDLRITPDTIAEGIRQTHWPGRFHVVPAAGDNPEFVFDVAHNPAGAWALRSTLSTAYQNSETTREITMIFGVMRDKAVQEIAEILFPIATHIIVTHSNNPRSATSSEIRQAASRVTAGIDIEEAENVGSALERAQKVAGKGGLVVVTGSIYIVGEAMRTQGVRI